MSVAAEHHVVRAVAQAALDRLRVRPGRNGERHFGARRPEAISIRSTRFMRKGGESGNGYEAV